MKQTIGLYEFRRAFEQCRPDNFSYEGQAILFDYLEEYSDSTGEDVEFDVVGLCCEYSEDTWKGIADNYRIELPEREENQDDDEYEEVCMDTVRDYLNDNTVLCGETSDGFVYQQF